MSEAAADNRITTDELQAMFGASIPLEAFAIIFRGEDDARTPDQVREELRAYLTATPARDEVKKVEAHTPTPWRIARIEEHRGFIGSSNGMGNGGIFIAHTLGQDSAANASLIVRAVNAYAPMLAALEEAISFQNEDTECLVASQAGDYFDEPSDEPCPERLCHDHGCMVARVNRWRAAIALAKEGR